jgi:hypothetical protein
MAGPGYQASDILIPAWHIFIIVIGFFTLALFIIKTLLYVCSQHTRTHAHTHTCMKRGCAVLWGVVLTFRWFIFCLLEKIIRGLKKGPVSGFSAHHTHAHTRQWALSMRLGLRHVVVGLWLITAKLARGQATTWRKTNRAIQDYTHTHTRTHTHAHARAHTQHRALPSTATKRRD